MTLKFVIRSLNEVATKLKNELLEDYFPEKYKQKRTLKKRLSGDRSDNYRNLSNLRAPKSVGFFGDSSHKEEQQLNPNQMDQSELRGRKSSLEEIDDKLEIPQKIKLNLSQKNRITDIRGNSADTNPHRILGQVH